MCFASALRFGWRQRSVTGARRLAILISSHLRLLLRDCLADFRQILLNIHLQHADQQEYADDRAQPAIVKTDRGHNAARLCRSRSRSFATWEFSCSRSFFSLLCIMPSICFPHKAKRTALTLIPFVEIRPAMSPPLCFDLFYKTIFSDRKIIFCARLTSNSNYCKIYSRIELLNFSAFIVKMHFVL